MVLCVSCSKELSDEARFCSNCGCEIKVVKDDGDESNTDRIGVLVPVLEQWLKKDSREMIDKSFACLNNRLENLQKSNEHIKELKIERSRAQQVLESYKKGLVMAVKRRQIDEVKWRREAIKTTKKKYDEDNKTILKIRTTQIESALLIELRREFEMGISVMSDYPIDLYKRIVNEHISRNHPHIDFTSIVPHESQYMNESNQIQAYLRKNLTEFFLLLGEWSVLQQQCQNMLPGVRMVIESEAMEWNLGNIGDLAAKYAGPAAIAIATKGVGAVVLAGAMWNDNKKKDIEEEQQKQFLSQFESLYQQFIDKSLMVKSSFEKWLTTLDYYDEKVQTITLGGVVNTLKVLDSRGEQLMPAKEYLPFI